MLERLIPKAVIFTLITLLLVSCGQIVPTPGTATSQPSTATMPPPTNFPATVTPTATPKPEILNYDQALPLFNYDSSIPFDLTVLSEKEKDGVIIQDLTYAAADPHYTSQTAGKIAAYLVKPSKAGSYAGVVYLHGLGGGWGNRKEFLNEAVSLAQEGVVSLLPTGQFPWVVTHTGIGEKDRMNVIKQVIELRRSFDFLLAQPGVDPKRIAFVGHDYGAMNGAVLSGVEKRVKAYVLMAGDTNYSDWAIMYFNKPANEDTYRALMSAVEPITYLPHASPSELFFQFGGRDGFISKQTADESFNAASEPKKFGWYDSGDHTLDKQSDLERLAWLNQQLNLKPVH